MGTLIFFIIIYFSQIKKKVMHPKKVIIQIDNVVKQKIIVHQE